METNKIPVQRPKTTSSINSEIIEQLKELNDQIEYANHRLESIELYTEGTRGGVKAILWIIVISFVISIMSALALKSMF